MKGVVKIRHRLDRLARFQFRIAALNVFRHQPLERHFASSHVIDISRDKFSGARKLLIRLIERLLLQLQPASERRLRLFLIGARRVASGSLWTEMPRRTPDRVLGAWLILTRAGCSALVSLGRVLSK